MREQFKFKGVSSMKNSNVVPSFETFSKLARQYNRIPIRFSYHADLETPLSAYLKLGKGKNAFLLESVEKNEQVARFSIVGFDPSEIFEANNGILIHRRGKKVEKRKSTNPLQDVKKAMILVKQAPAEETG